MKLFFEPPQFQWDTGNRDKNFVKHGVGNEECEEVFFDEKKRLVKDIFHSGAEERYILIGKTKQNKLLFIVFTIRRRCVRVISARTLNKKEHCLYEEKTSRAKI